MLDLAVFVPRLRQVIGWTAHLAQGFDYHNGLYGTVFRQFNPLFDGVPLFTILEAGYTVWNKDVHELSYLRQALQQAVGQRDEQPVKLDFNLNNFNNLGRILYFETRMATTDGAPIMESDCFVDECDVPPIDTWFYFDEEKRNLFCWIPWQFEQVMQQAIDAELFGSYHWLDKEGPNTHARIVAAMTS
jgi:hypothetical protein